MKLFKTFAFYLAIGGMILAALLIKIINRPPPEPVHVAEPAVNPYKSAIAASGIVEAADKNLSIGAPEEGIVTKAFVAVGAKVKRGDPLFQVDSRTLEAELLTERSNVAVAKASLARLRDQLQRLKAVSDPRAVSIEELRTKENDVFVSEAQLAAAQAQVARTELLVERRTVKAPKDGVVLQDNVREGEYVTKSTTTIILGDLDTMQVRADIDEQNAGWFDPASTAVAYPKNNTSIAIPLTFVRLEPFVIPKRSLTGASDERVDTRVLQVIYSFEQPEDYQLFVGQQVDLFIERKQSKKAHASQP